MRSGQLHAAHVVATDDQCGTWDALVAKGLHQVLHALARRELPQVGHDGTDDPHLSRKAPLGGSSENSSSIRPLGMVSMRSRGTPFCTNCPASAADTAINLSAPPGMRPLTSRSQTALIATFLSNLGKVPLGVIT